MVHDITYLPRDPCLVRLVWCHQPRRVWRTKRERTRCCSKRLEFEKRSRTVCVSLQTRSTTISVGQSLEFVSVLSKGTSFGVCAILLINVYLVAKFQYTFFDAFGQNGSIPDLPITPFPTLFTAPNYRAPNNTLELTVANFFYEDPKTRAQTPLDVYIGALGPLTHRLYQASPPGPLTNVSPFVQSVSAAENAPNELMRVGNVPPANPNAPLATRYLPPGPVHTIVVVDMPSLAEVVQALEDDAVTPTGENSPDKRGAQKSDGNTNNNQKPDAQVITGRSLPLLFVRSVDGVGYHSGRAITCENVFQSMDLTGLGGTNPAATTSIDTGWLAAAQAAAVAEGSLNGWSMRVI